MKKMMNKNKLFTILLILVIITIIIGIFYLTIIDNESKLLIINNIKNYFKNIKTIPNTNDIIFKTIFSNLSLIIIIWLLGISILGLPIIIILFLFKIFQTTFTFTSIIYTYKYKGIILSLIYIIPHIINIFILLILTYYALNFGIMIYKIIFKKKEYNKNIIVNRYIKILIFTISTILITSIIEVYIIPKIIYTLYF